MMIMMVSDYENVKEELIFGSCLNTETDHGYGISFYVGAHVALIIAFDCSTIKNRRFKLQNKKECAG
jgi:hypothetical protein